MADNSDFLSKINELIGAHAVFVLARIISSDEQSKTGRRFLFQIDGTVVSESGRGDDQSYEKEMELVTVKARELLAANSIGVHTLWHHSDNTWTTRKQDSSFAVMFEIIRPQPELLICGAGHVGNAVARLGAFLEYKVTVIDERVEFANRHILPDQRIELIARPFDLALRDAVITTSTNIVIVTRGHAQDETCLREVINSHAGYIGMIGSKRRVNAVLDRLINDGVSRGLTNKIHAPIGLRIGAKTPEEIAVAILAEIISIQYQSQKL